MGCSKPFDDLDADHLGQELVARGIYDFERTKKERLQLLKETLKGIQRVPTLLLNNPTETLTQVHLEGYTILDCEPLHDIKGHIDNLLQELPHILETELSNEVEQLLQVDLWSKKNKRGGDYRLAIIHVLSLLRGRQTPPKILQLVETAVDLSCLIYQKEANRS